MPLEKYIQGAKEWFVGEEKRPTEVPVILESDPRNFEKRSTQVGYRTYDRLQKRSESVRAAYYQALVTFKDVFISKFKIDIRFGRYGFNNKEKEPYKNFIPRLLKNENVPTLQKKVLFAAFTRDFVVESVCSENFKNLDGVIDKYEKALTDEVFPSWVLHEGALGDEVAIDPYAINPVTFLASQKFFANIENHVQNFEHLTPEQKENFWNQLIMGKIYGFFDEENQNNLYFRQLITPLLTETDIACLRELRYHESDSKKLELLKGTWHKIFTKYWVSLARPQTDGVVMPLAQSSKQAADKRLPPYMQRIATPNRFERTQAGGRDRTPMARAQQLDELVAHTQKVALQEYLVQLVNAYAGSETIQYHLVKKIFSHTTAYKVFGYLSGKFAEVGNDQVTGAVLAESAQELEAVFPSTESGSVLVSIFGTEWNTISSIEKVCLIAFVSFISNGQILSNTREVVGLLQNKLLPILETHTDAVYRKPEKKLFVPQTTRWDDYRNAAKAAQKRLAGFSLEKDHITSAQSDEALAYFDQREKVIDEFRAIDAKFADRFKVKRLKDTLEKETKTSKMIMLFLSCLFAIVISSYEEMHLFIGDAGYKPLLGILVTMIGPIGALMFLKEGFPFRVVPKLDNSDKDVDKVQEDIKEIAELVEKEYKKDKRNVIISYVISYILSLLLSMLLSHGGGGQTTKPPSEQPSTPQSVPNFEPSFTEKLERKLSQLVDHLSGKEEEKIEDHPQFMVYGKQSDALFWPQDQVSRLPDSSLTDLITRNITEFEAPLNTLDVEYEDSVAAFNQAIQSNSQKESTLVRFNLKGGDRSFQTPVGYEAKKVLIMSKERKYRALLWTNGIIRLDFDYPQSGSTSESEKDVYAAVVYTKTPDETEYTFVQPVSKVFMKDDSIVEYKDALPVLPPTLRDLVEYINGPSYPKDGSTHDSLEMITFLLSQMGVKIGKPDSAMYQNTDNSPLKASLEHLRALTQSDQFGNLKYQVWSPDDVLFVTLQLARLSNLHAHEVNGYYEAPNTQYSGYIGDRQNRLMYQDEKTNGWKFFDVTKGFEVIPGTERGKQKQEEDVLAKMLEAEERRKKIMELSLVGLGLLVTGAGAQVIRSRKMNEKINTFSKEAKEKREQLQRQLEKTPPAIELSCWTTLLSVLGVRDLTVEKEEETIQDFPTTWFSFHYGELELNQENAQKLANDFVLLAIKEKKVAFYNHLMEKKIEDFSKQFTFNGVNAMKRKIFITAACKQWFGRLLFGKTNNTELLLDKINSSFALLIPAIETTIRNLSNDVEKQTAQEALRLLKMIEKNFSLK